MPKLGVNIDHIATLRQARKEDEPDPVTAAQLCANAGADSIVAHLREDRRHIQDKDILRLKDCIRCRLNLEMSLDPKIIKLAARVKPDQVTIVPEKRQEVTTEGGLNVITSSAKLKKLKKALGNKTEISLFIDPIKVQVKKVNDLGFKNIEIHTGKYASAKTKAIAQKELKKIKDIVEYAQKLGLTVNAGHGLKYSNVKPIAQIHGIEELNIGHSIIARSVFVGLGNAVREMQNLIY